MSKKRRPLLVATGEGSRLETIEERRQRLAAAKVPPPYDGTDKLIARFQLSRDIDDIGTREIIRELAIAKREHEWRCSLETHEPDARIRAELIEIIARKFVSEKEWKRAQTQAASQEAAQKRTAKAAERRQAWLAVMEDYKTRYPSWTASHIAKNVHMKFPRVSIRTIRNLSRATVPKNSWPPPNGGGQKSGPSSSMRALKSHGADDGRTRKTPQLLSQAEIAPAERPCRIHR